MEGCRERHRGTREREALINALIPRSLYVVREVLEYERVALAGVRCRRTVELTI